MKFSIRNKKNTKGFTKISVSYVWIKNTNLYIFVSYRTKGGCNVATECCFASIDGDREIWIHGNNGKKHTLCLRPIPENEKVFKLLKDCWSYLLSSDYCDTQIVLMPPLKNRNWMKAIRTKVR